MKPIRTKTKLAIKYTINGVLHREDGPAIIWNSGEMNWYINNVLHRTDGPATIHANGTMLWFKHESFHREDGPAVVYPSGEDRYYVNGKIALFPNTPIFSKNIYYER